MRIKVMALWTMTLMRLKYIFRLRRILPETTSIGRTDALIHAGAMPANSPSSKASPSCRSQNVPSEWMLKGMFSPTGLRLSSKGASKKASGTANRKQTSVNSMDSPRTRLKMPILPSPTSRRVAISRARSPEAAILRLT